MKPINQDIKEKLEQEILKLVKKYSKLWWETGRQEEVLLFSHQKAVADEILKLLSQVKENTIEEIQKHIHDNPKDYMNDFDWQEFESWLDSLKQK